MKRSPQLRLLGTPVCVWPTGGGRSFCKIQTRMDTSFSLMEGEHLSTLSNHDGVSFSEFAACLRSKGGGTLEVLGPMFCD